MSEAAEELESDEDEIPLRAQIVALEAQVDQLQRYLSRRVKLGGLTQRSADRTLARLRAAALTLQRCSPNYQPIRYMEVMDGKAMPRPDAVDIVLNRVGEILKFVSPEKRDAVLAEVRKLR